MMQMKKSLPRRLMALLLCLCMLSSTFAVTANATGDTQEGASESNVELPAGGEDAKLPEDGNGDPNVGEGSDKEETGGNVELPAGGEDEKLPEDGNGGSDAGNPDGNEGGSDVGNPDGNEGGSDAGNPDGNEGGSSEEQPGNNEGGSSEEQPGNNVDGSNVEQPGDKGNGSGEGQADGNGNGSGEGAADGNGDNSNGAQVFSDRAVTQFTLNLKPQEDGSDLKDFYVSGEGFWFAGGNNAGSFYNIQNNQVSSLEPGRIYQLFIENINGDYVLDMGGGATASRYTEIWLYVSDNGIEPINADSYNRLMTEDSTFARLINEILADEELCYYFLERYLGMLALITPPTKEKLNEYFQNRIDTLPNPSVTQEGTDAYKMVLTYSKSKPATPQKLTIVAVDETSGTPGTPLEGIPYYLTDISGRGGSDGEIGPDGVILELEPGIHIVEVYGGVEEAGSVKPYIRKDAANTPDCPANIYSLVLYVTSDNITLVNPANYEELSKADSQFQAAVEQGMGAIIKPWLAGSPNIEVENGVLTLPFVQWEKRPTVIFKAYDKNDTAKNPLQEIQFRGSGTDNQDGTFTTTLMPGLNSVMAWSSTSQYMASEPLFQFDGGPEHKGSGDYNIFLWVKPDGAYELVDDAKLKELCQDEAFINLMLMQMMHSSSPGMMEEFLIYGIKPGYEVIRQYLGIWGDYTLEKDTDEVTYLLPFTNERKLTLSKVKDETVFGAANTTPVTITYTCPADGDYKVGMSGDASLTVNGDGFNDYNVGSASTIALKGGKTYTFTLTPKGAGYFKVFVEKLSDINVGTSADLTTADYIKDGAYSNMVSFSCGTKTEHLILARYPGGQAGSNDKWTFHVAMPSGVDYQENTLKIQYLPDSGVKDGSAPIAPISDIKNQLKLDIQENKLNLQPLNDVTWEGGERPGSFSDKTDYYVDLTDKGLKTGDILAITYTGEVNTAAWYGSIVDSNMSYGYWSAEDAYGATESYDRYFDPAICQVFGIKIYKYSNYDRMLAGSAPGFDQAVVLAQEHLLKGAEFKIEGENLSKVIVIRDDLVSLEDNPKEEAATFSARGAEGASGAGAALAQLMDEETMLKLLYYRYEQGLQELSNVSVAQTQTYYALNEDELYTREAPDPNTIQFYADNGQGYRLKPTAFAAQAGETVRAGDGGGLLLGGLGAGKYTLTEVKAPEGYAKIQPMTISIEWVMRDGDGRGYVDLPDGAVPDRDSGDYGLICRINGVDTPTLKTEGVWYPGDYSWNADMIEEFGGYSSIWNPWCFVLVNPIGDDRISLAATKAVNDPADQTKDFTLKYTIKDPNGNICTDVKYAILDTDGQFVTQNRTIAKAEDWSYTFKPGEQIAFLNLREGSTYQVTEESGATSQYVVSYENGTGTVQYDSGYPTATVTNKKGELVISKTVTGGGDTSKEFTFWVELTDKDGKDLIDVTYVKGTQAPAKLSSGAEIRLKHGESVKLYLPIGTKYKVTEQSEEGYTTTATNAEGTVSNADVIQAAFTNKKADPTPPPTEPPKDPTGGLTVSKTVDGDGADKKKEWNFTVKLDSPIDGTYGEMTFKKGVAKFKLAHGESMTAENLPAGITYTVSEAEANKKGYKTEASGEKGTIPENGIAKAKFQNHKDAEPPKRKIPWRNIAQTGDTSHIVTWIALMALSVVGLGAAIFFFKKQSKRKKKK